MGACGLYCGACAIYRAREYPELAEEIAAHFNCRPEQIACDGCHGQLDRRWSDEKCRHWLLAEVLGDVRACRPEHAYAGSDQAARNLERLRAVGASAWLEEQVRAWACPDCGTAMIQGRLGPCCRGCTRSG